MFFIRSGVCLHYTLYCALRFLLWSRQKSNFFLRKIQTINVIIRLYYGIVNVYIDIYDNFNEIQNSRPTSHYSVAVCMPNPSDFVGCHHQLGNQYHLKNTID